MCMEAENVDGKTLLQLVDSLLFGLDGPGVHEYKLAYNHLAFSD